MANVTYTVKSGDTLSKIARNYDTTVAKLLELNPKVKARRADGSLIYVGEVIVVSGTAAASSSGGKSSTRATNVVLAPWAGDERQLLATWDWSRESETEHYQVEWWWGPEGQQGIVGQEGQEDRKYSIYTIPAEANRVNFRVKPIAKKYKPKGSDTEVSYFTASWTAMSDNTAYRITANPPSVPSAPDVEIKDGKMTITVDGLDENTTGIIFEIVKDEKTSWVTDEFKVRFSSVTYTINVDVGSKYKVRCRAVKGDYKSDFGPYSGISNTPPAASKGFITCVAESSTSVRLTWHAVTNAETYDIEYATKKEYFDNSDQTTLKEGIEEAQFIVTGLESGQEYFFRVRAVNEGGKSAWCTKFAAIKLGKKPSPPTTWSSTTTAIVGETLTLFWVHNSEDGSTQTSGQLELDTDGVIKTVTIPKTVPEEEEEKVSEYVFDMSGYTEGTTLKWRVRTCGITGEYSDWSIQRIVDIYAKPTLILRLTDTSDNLIDTLTAFPLRITATAGPNTQTPIGFHMRVVAKEGYETVDIIGNKTVVNEGGEVFSKHFDISEQFETLLSANDLDLENGVNYTVKCTVTMDSGLTADASSSFFVDWSDFIYEPNASVGVDQETYTAMIRPYCIDEDNELLENVTLSVYRRTFNNEFVPIATGLANTESTYIIDPHPALDYARYRIVAVASDTGAVSYTDLSGVYVGGVAVIIQWEEEWTEFDATESGYSTTRPWGGSMLRIPYNIDVSNDHGPDVALVEYIGRKHPVSYYGTQLGETATWNVEIPKYDKETLYAIRRLAAWMGDVYVREPSGSGYWANIKVSFNQKHVKTTIPVTFNITRVEGGV